MEEKKAKSGISQKPRSEIMVGSCSKHGGRLRAGRDLVQELRWHRREKAM